MRKIILILALILWACGAPSEVDSAKAQEQRPGGEAAEETTQNRVADSDRNRPLGQPLPVGVPNPVEAPDIWREVPAENLLYMKTLHGITLIEMAPDFAPNHVQRMREFASNGYFVGLPFHRVLKEFMAQAGEPSLVRRDPPTTPPLVGEFMFRRTLGQKIKLVGEDRNFNTGFVDGFPIVSQPDELAMMTADGRVRASGLHCPGAAAMARTNDPNSANAQFYITTGNPEWLNTKYTVWGRVRAGQNAVTEIKLGEPAYPPDLIDGMTLGSDVADKDRARVWVMRTDSAAFAAHLEQQKNDDGKLPGVCKIPVPVYVQWEQAVQ